MILTDTNIFAYSNHNNMWVKQKAKLLAITFNHLMRLNIAMSGQVVSTSEQLMFVQLMIRMGPIFAIPDYIILFRWDCLIATLKL